MLLCIMPVSYADDADFECSAISYTDASGKPVTSITPGTTLKAGMMVKPNSGASGSLVLQ